MRQRTAGITTTLRPRVPSQPVRLLTPPLSEENQGSCLAKAETLPWSGLSAKKGSPAKRLMHLTAGQAQGLMF